MTYKSPCPLCLCGEHNTTDLSGEPSANVFRLWYRSNLGVVLEYRGFSTRVIRPKILKYFGLGTRVFRAELLFVRYLTGK